ncbi:nuclear transport factor 2 family protein [Streptomyces lancefieldiae]|uniref:Nuclear transport factor 2 family protein n=1 Tax=Streptomyces lancefieldiae TaxID=3075520 RepID=A0ABU3ARC4_9ACTN|nr:nuclear transport factor 2 family protein [Streptomyces sp. DSM 40712]MDT0612724.1 nuclear transport factor 2 family protein [Streptomyces sp. DSM 40712]
MEFSGMTYTRNTVESATSSAESSEQSRASVAALLNRYLVSLDDTDDTLDDDWADGLFTEDAVVAFPMSRHQGRAGMAAYHSTALTAFAATQHLGGAPVVVLDGDRATLRANLISTHVHHARHTPPQGELPPLFATGTFVTGRARRTGRGWRLSELSFRLLWADGSPAPAA